MKVLLLIGMLAIVQASGQYDSLLQRLGERQLSPKEGDQGDQDDEGKNIYDIDALNGRVANLEVAVQEILKQLNGEPKQQSQEQGNNGGTGNDDDSQPMRAILEKIKSRMATREESQMKSDALSLLAKKMSLMQEP